MKAPLYVLFSFCVVTPLLLSEENSPPMITISNDSFEILSPYVLQVTALCEDDGLPVDQMKDSFWELLSGEEAGVAITKLSEHSGSFTFSIPGQYTLRFVASDGEYESSRDFYVEVATQGIISTRSFQVSDEAYNKARLLWNDLKVTYYFEGIPTSEVLGFSSSDYLLLQDQEVIVTLLHDGASYRNSLAWYDANEEGEDDGHLIWHDVATGPGAPLSQGSRASLGLLPQGTNLRFYLIQDGAGVGTSIIAQDQERNPGSQTLVAGNFPNLAPNTQVLAFEDKPSTSNSFDDVVIQVEFVGPGHEEAQWDQSILGKDGLISDRGSRGVKVRLETEGLTHPDHEIIGGVFQLPLTDTTYEVSFLDDRSPMKFTFGATALDQVNDLGLPSLLFRETAITEGVVILDDRPTNPGMTVTFRPQDHGLAGKRVIFWIIPNNTQEVFLRNPWRYTPRGDGNNTKRQPLFSIPGANPGCTDQFFAFGNEEKTLFTIEDHSREPAMEENGNDSDHSFDDIQLSISPPLVLTSHYNGYYGKTVDYTLGYESNDGLAPPLELYDAKKIMLNAPGSRRWDLLFSSLTQPDGQFMVSEFGESLPISETGAISVNIEWEEGIRSNYFIEQQRYGADIIETGIILEDHDLIADGIRMINWGFSRQASDGSFPGTGDAVHSASLFLEASARAGLALKKYKPRSYRRTIKQWRRKTHLLAHWFVDADDHGRDVNLEPFGHRYFLRGAALSQAARFTRDRSLDSFAWEYIEAGINQQEPDGTMQERGGFDASYQMVGMAFASRYFSTARKNNRRTQASLAIWKGISRFLIDVRPTGEVIIDPGSRTATEVSRSGAAKRFDHKHTTKALVFAEEGLLMPGAEDAAELILNFYDVLPGQ